MKIEALVIIGIAVAVLYRILLWLMEAARTPDPWGHEIEETIEQEDVAPLCPHCLTLQEHNGWFCPECGSTVGPFCNYLPSVYIFSVGEGARAGVTQRTLHRPLVMAGYVLIALGYFPFILAVCYLVFLIRNLKRISNQSQESPPPLSS